MLIGLSIDYATNYRGVQQHFSSQFHYANNTAVTAPSEAIVDEVVGVLRNLHSSDVNFMGAKVWTAGGTKAENQMIFEKNLSGTGNQGTSVNHDRERAILIRWKAGFDVRGLPVYLRKWLHTCGAAAGQAFGTGTVLSNTGEIPAAMRTAIANEANKLLLVAGGFWRLNSAKSRNPDNDASASCHRYLEHRQLGDAWR